MQCICSRVQIGRIIRKYAEQLLKTNLTDMQESSELKAATICWIKIYLGHLIVQRREVFSWPFSTGIMLKVLKTAQLPAHSETRPIFP